MKYPKVTFTIHDPLFAEQEVTGRQYGDWAVIPCRQGGNNRLIAHVPTGQVLRVKTWYNDTPPQAAILKDKQAYAIATEFADVPRRNPDDDNSRIKTLAEYLSDDFPEYAAACLNVRRYGYARYRQEWQIPNYRSWQCDVRRRAEAAAKTTVEPGLSMDWSAGSQGDGLPQHFRLTSDGRTLCGHGGDVWKYGRDQQEEAVGFAKCTECEKLLESCARKFHPVSENNHNRDLAIIKAMKKQRPPATEIEYTFAANCPEAERQRIRNVLGVSNERV
jgi:hypothetical protein